LEKEKVKGGCMFYSTKRRCKIPVPNTSTAIIFGGGTATVVEVINVFGTGSRLHSLREYPSRATHIP
jgi:hypothetical protein